VFNQPLKTVKDVEDTKIFLSSQILSRMRIRSHPSLLNSNGK